MARTTAQDRPTPAQVDERIALADAALGAAGHSVEDPVLRQILTRVVAGDLSRADGAEQARRHIESNR